MSEKSPFPQVNKKQLEADYSFCQSIIKKHSKSFYYAFSRLPKDQAKAIYAIYAFCRMADDAVDEANNQKSQTLRLDQLEMELQLFEKGKEPSQPMWRALRDVFSRYPMDIQPFYNQLKGQRQDIDFVQPQTLEDLETYSYYVAGSVGLMLLPILSNSATQEVKESAIALGIAMQLTNILRDVGEDLMEINRVYLPLKMMEEERYSFQDLEAHKINDSFIRLWERIAERAEQLYTEFHEHIWLFGSESRLPVLTSAKVYSGLLDAVRSNDYDCFSRENTVPLLQKERLMREAKYELLEAQRQWSDREEEEG